MYISLQLKRRLAAALCLVLAAALTVILTAQAIPQESDSVKIPIIMYHSLLKDSKRWNDYVIPPSAFEADLKYITENGYQTVVIEDLQGFVYNGTPLPEKPVLLSFDDGNYNNCTYALPLLQKYGCKAVISPIASCCEQFADTEKISPSYGYCNAQALRIMQESGCFEIQNHSYDLHSTSPRKGVGRLKGESADDYRNVITADIQRAQDFFKAELSYTPACFTYPFGERSRESDEIIKELGFTASLSCTQKTAEISRNNKESLYNLGRYIRTNKITAEQILTGS